MPKRIFRVLAIWIVLCSSAAAAVPPLTPEQVLSGGHFRYDLPIDLSPDGKWVAYVLQDFKRIQVASDLLYFRSTGASELVDYGCDVWISDTATGEARNLTGSQGTNWGPAWSRDSNYLAFYSDRSGDVRVWIWERRTGLLRQAATASAHVFALEERPFWSADGRYLVTKLLPEGLTRAKAQAGMYRQPTRSKEGAEFLLYEAGPDFLGTHDTSPDRNPMLTERSRVDIGRIEVKSGAVERLARAVVVTSPLWPSPDASRIAYTATDRIPTFGGAKYGLFVAFADRRSPVAVLPGSAEAAWHPDGRRLSYAEVTPSKVLRLALAEPGSASGPRYVDIAPGASSAGDAPVWTGPSTAWVRSGNRLFRVSLDGAFAEETPFSGRRIVETAAAGASLLVITRDAQKREAVLRIAASGPPETLLAESARRLNIPRVSANGGVMALSLESADQAVSIYISTDSLKTTRQLTRTPYDGMKLGTSRLLEYKDAHGRALQAALLVPADYVEGKRYPMIVWGYAGASDSQMLNHFGFLGDGSSNMHLFTTRGWAVLAPDLPPAVQNRMAETTDAMLAGVDAAIAAGVADPDRLGVFGQSNGGYTCLSVLTQTNRFKAGVMSAGFGDYFGSYGHMRLDGELYSSYYRESQNGGDPWAQRNVYIANSPWFSLDKVTTPLLVLHGEQDHTLPVWQAEAVVVGLARLGRTVSFARFTGEGHVPARWKWANQLEYDRRMIAWFEKYLR